MQSLVDIKVCRIGPLRLPVVLVYGSDYWVSTSISCICVQKVHGYTIPAGHQVCVSPTTNHHLPDTWDDVEQFKPDRYAVSSHYAAYSTQLHVLRLGQIRSDWIGAYPMMLKTVTTSVDAGDVIL